PLHALERELPAVRRALLLPPDRIRVAPGVRPADRHPAVRLPVELLEVVEGHGSSLEMPRCTSPFSGGRWVKVRMRGHRGLALTGTTPQSIRELNLPREAHRSGEEPIQRIHGRARIDE